VLPHRGRRPPNAIEIYIIFIKPAARTVSILYVPLAILTAARGTRPPEFRVAGSCPPVRASRWSFAMLDAVYLAIGFGFVAIAVLYVVACDRI
jgi:hypothetical protein